MWEPISAHPLILALAVKYLLASQVFQPAPAELRKAMLLVERRLTSLRAHTESWLRTLHETDKRLFADNPGAWCDGYCDLDARALLIMSDLDAADPRLIALEAMWSAREEVEA